MAAGDRSAAREPRRVGDGRGNILNPLAGRNQIEGAVIMGIGMALFEHTEYDLQNGGRLTPVSPITS